MKSGVRISYRPLFFALYYEVGGSKNLLKTSRLDFIFPFNYHLPVDYWLSKKGCFMVTKEKRLYQFSIFLFIFLSLIAISSDFAFAQTVILNQAPDHYIAYISDPDFSQSVAENFIVSSTGNVTQIKIWGCYVSSNLVPATDSFTVIFHADSSGSPGAAISTQNNVPVVRQATGGFVAFGYSEYLYTLTLATPVNLTPGTYWVEIYNNSTGDFFAWESGTLDPANGISGFAGSDTVPGSSWVVSGSGDLAIQILIPTVNAVPIPSMNEWGMIVFMILAGVGSVIYLRRQRRIES